MCERVRPHTPADMVALHSSVVLVVYIVPFTVFYQGLHPNRTFFLLLTRRIFSNITKEWCYYRLADNHRHKSGSSCSNIISIITHVLEIWEWEVRLSFPCLYCCGCESSRWSQQAADDLFPSTTLKLFVRCEWEMLCTPSVAPVQVPSGKVFKE